LTDPDRITCVACRHEIDASAKICPYCGADPRTGEKIVDAQAILAAEFHPRRGSSSEGVLQYARQRQGVVAVIGAFVLILVLAAVHQYVTHRNQTAVSQASAVPLTDVTDLSNQPDEVKAQQMPDLQFQYDGHPQTMRTFIVEPGAVTPPDVLAAQQAAAQAAQQKAAAAQQAKPAPAAAPAPQPPAPQPQPPAKH
jgi:hypothetical protein